MGDGEGLMMEVEVEVEVAMGVCAWMGAARVLVAAWSWAHCSAWRRECGEWQKSLVKNDFLKTGLLHLGQRRKLLCLVLLQPRHQLQPIG